MGLYGKHCNMSEINNEEACDVSEEELREINELIEPLLSDENIWGHEANFADARIGLYCKVGKLKRSEAYCRRVVFELITRWQALRRERDENNGDNLYVIKEVDLEAPPEEW